ncbi:uncharacterized protein LOC112572754 [Pomacea canaliculata]|uniref:uncharacterized protein LOC112572754 n=1 Tax=Pomacea canaliculata TaxID=400727 RepID=UPI000D72D1EC|nr:uncharacterized protein LOC112572754 [Pomacea canaliculata]
MRVLLILLVGLLVVGEGTCFLNDLYKERSMPSERFLSTGDRKARAIASLFTPGRALPTGDMKAPVTVLLSALRKDGGRRWGPDSSELSRGDHHNINQLIDVIFFPALFFFLFFFFLKARTMFRKIITFVSTK